MKTLYSFLFFFSLHITYAQVVNIPNSSFLQHLTNCNSVNSNDDGVFDNALLMKAIEHEWIGLNKIKKQT